MGTRVLIGPLTVSVWSLNIPGASQRGVSVLGFGWESQLCSRKSCAVLTFVASGIKDEFGVRSADNLRPCVCHFLVFVLSVMMKVIFKKDHPPVARVGAHYLT